MDIPSLIDKNVVRINKRIQTWSDIEPSTQRPYVIPTFTLAYDNMFQPVKSIIVSLEDSNKQRINSYSWKR